MKKLAISSAIILLSGLTVKAQDFPVYQPLPIAQQPVVVRPVPIQVQIQNNNYIHTSPIQSNNISESELLNKRLNARLDQKHGFKDLVLGSEYLSLTKIATLFPLEKASNPNLKAYQLYNIAAYDFVGQKIKSMTLEFLNNRLVNIAIELPNYNYKQELVLRNAVLNDLTSAYGDWYSIKLSSTHVNENVSKVLVIPAQRTTLMAFRYIPDKNDSNGQKSRGDTFQFFSNEYSKLLFNEYNYGLYLIFIR